MSDATDDEPGPARKVLRTVTPSYSGRPDREMDTIGWGIFLALAILLVPLLPFIVVVFVVSKTIELVRRQTA